MVVSVADCETARSMPGLTELAVDIHCGPRALDSMPFEYLLQNSVKHEIGGAEVRVPCPEDHLRILCVHWLTDGGERKDRLWDIFWAVKNRPESFAWDKCLKVVSERRRRWIVCTIGLAHRYLDLPIDDLPFREQALDLPAWLTRAVEKRWRTGVTHVPIHKVLRDRKAFLQQMRKRFPPNPVMATINMEGNFDSFTRIHYQAGHILKQALPSVHRIWRTISSRNR